MPDQTPTTPPPEPLVMDSIWWTVLSTVIVFGWLGFLLAANYKHFDPPRDLETIGETAALYLVVSLSRRAARMRERGNREKALAATVIPVAKIEDALTPCLPTDHASQIVARVAGVVAEHKADMAAENKP
jgi:hypothetical protein